MKNCFRTLMLLLLIALITTTAACVKKETSPTAASPTVAATAAAPTDAPTEARIVQTQAPVPETEAATSEEATDIPDTTDAPSSGNSFDTATLTGSSWTLTSVTVNGEQQSPAVYYGSIIRQTGAYLAFSDDGTFSCVLGGVGCSGDYAVSDAGISLHITTKFTAASEGESCDENQTLVCDPAAETIRFDYNGAVNIFTKR